MTACSSEKKVFRQAEIFRGVANALNELREKIEELRELNSCLLYTSPSPRDRTRSRMPSSA